MHWKSAYIMIPILFLKNTLIQLHLAYNNLSQAKE